MANNQFNAAKANFSFKGWLMVIYMLIVFYLTFLVIEYRGPHNFRRAFEVIYPIHQIPGSLGAIFMMFFSTKFGSYSAGYIALLILMIVMLALFFIVHSGDFVKKQEAKWKN